MTTPTPPSQPSGPARKPSMREVLRPAELVGGSALLAVFAGVVMIVATRSWIVASVGFGVVFIVSLVVVALFVQSLKPSAEETADIAEQDAAHGGTRGVLEPKPGEENRSDGH